ncbi:MAG: protoporphyrinogen/coproporphyrinogen oxidase [Gemmatimonadales bacterium]
MHTTDGAGNGPRILIIGAGPTGLAAGYRLRELGHTNFLMLEASSKVGGLAASEQSAAGFTYDIGGHVLFSHYPYFDKLFDTLMGDDYQTLRREAWIWMQDRFIPYPFQSHIRHLPPELALECVMGLIQAQQHGVDLRKYRTFEDLIVGVFGDGIARLFMMPYNFKVWAHPPRMMNKEWIGERMAVVNLQKVLGNIILQQDDVAWGPNSTFKYPRYGGTGGLFARMQPHVQDQLRLNARVATVNPLRKEVQLEDGTTERYDLLLSTMPLDLLVQRMTEGVPDEVREQAALLRHSGSYIVGVGLRQPAPSEKCWIYFPEDDCPFYRVTYLSNYSPDVVPDPATHYSLLAEISRSEFKPVDRATVVDDTIDGMVATRLLREEDRKDIVDAHLIERDYTYPVPSLERDRALACLLPWLDSEGVFSRGRFGAWRYEVGNMDHSVAQGVEWVDRVLLGGEAEELTYQARRGC